MSLERESGRERLEWAFLGQLWAVLILHWATRKGRWEERLGRGLAKAWVDSTIAPHYNLCRFAKKEKSPGRNQWINAAMGSWEKILTYRPLGRQTIKNCSLFCSGFWQSLFFNSLDRLASLSTRCTNAPAHK